MLILDTSFLVALANERDAHHDAARGLQAKIDEGRWTTLLLPEYVFLETVTVLMARRDLGFARRFGEGLLQASEVEFVPSSQYFLETWSVFGAQDEGPLGFTDANIVAVAQARGVQDVATFDRGFDEGSSLNLLPST